MKPKPKTKPKGFYIKKLDALFSTFLRLSYSNDFGMSSCYTCGKVAHYKDLQCGHYISRANMATRWSEENCRPQCIGCNIFKNGNYTEYSYRLLKEIGEDGMDTLMNKKGEIRQWSIKEIKEKIEEYKKKIENL